MKPGPFTQWLALLARVDGATLIVIVRALREARILPVGARGMNALEVDGDYLAKVLIARMATDKPARTVECYTRFANMQLANPDMHWLVESKLPDPDHTLLDLFRVICDPETTLPKKEKFVCTFTGQAEATLRFGRKTLFYIDRAEMAAGLQALEAANDDPALESAFYRHVIASPMSTHGIIEARSFTSAWLEGAKRSVFHDHNPDEVK